MERRPKARSNARRSSAAADGASAAHARQRAARHCRHHRRQRGCGIGEHCAGCAAVVQALTTPVLCIAGKREAAGSRQAKLRAQLKLAELRFGDAVVHKKFGRGIVSALESNRAEGGQVEVYWLNPYLRPPWRGPRVRASELSHDWDLQAEWQDTWEHVSDDDWEP